MRFQLIFAVAALAWSAAATARTVTLDHGGFKLEYDCDRRTAVRFEYRAGADHGAVPRPSRFTADPDLPAGCGRQYATTSYARVASGWDRGHLVPANHMDHDVGLIRRTHYMSNIVPQNANFNRGLWARTEALIECYRDLSPVTVYGGVVFSDPGNDHFLASHGLPTPDFFWKTLITADPATGAVKTISWYLPNTGEAGPLDRHLVSIAELEERLGTQRVAIDAAAAVKAYKPAVSWARPAGCRSA
ncbi:DNA/RNA non-specific endonuclease [Paludibacterium yongneupense]|uniref:DNA/RNA non-specific endonuclease n=1 Tax=Paludibacterium yongneupense TaxID=400061 RepID=UPI00040765EA|nr:DNA/RNA non-specific endonuclease [Paludibacterium yongneupense]